MRVLLMYVIPTRSFELPGRIAVLVPLISGATGIALCILLIAILPSNFHGAFQRVECGVHGIGPMYLLVRIPAQLFLVGGVHWFAGIADEAATWLNDRGRIELVGQTCLASREAAHLMDCRRHPFVSSAFGSRTSRLRAEVRS